MKLKYIYLLKLLITKQNNFKRSFIMNFTKKNYEILLFFWKNNYIFGFNVISQHKILVFLKTTKLNYIKTLKISPFFFFNNKTFYTIKFLNPNFLFFYKLLKNVNKN